MPFFVIFILVFSLFVLGVRMKSSFSQVKEEKTVTSQKITNSSRAEIEDMLKQIGTKKAPERREGAMCYKMALPPEYQEYVCPIDGEKTVYDKKDINAYWRIRNIVEMRRLVEHINSVTNLAHLKLDESKLCSKCFPDLKSEDRHVSLVTKYPDGKKHIYSKVFVDDLRILVGFFEKKLFYKTNNDGEVPLKNETAKIREILGIQIEHSSKEDKK